MGKKNCVCCGKLYCLIVGIALVIRPILIWTGVMGYEVPAWETICSLGIGIVGVVIGLMMKCESCCEKKEETPNTPAEGQQ